MKAIFGRDLKVVVDGPDEVSDAVLSWARAAKLVVSRVDGGAASNWLPVEHRTSVAERLEPAPDTGGFACERQATIFFSASPPDAGQFPRALSGKTDDGDMCFHMWPGRPMSELAAYLSVTPIDMLRVTSPALTNDGVIGELVARSLKETVHLFENRAPLRSALDATEHPGCSEIRLQQYLGLLHAVFPYEIHVDPDGTWAPGDHWRYVDVRQARLLAKWLICDDGTSQRSSALLSAAARTIAALHQVAERAVHEWRSRHVHRAPRNARTGSDSPAYVVVRDSVSAKLFEFAENAVLDMLMRTELEDLFFLATLLEKMPSEMHSRTEKNATSSSSGPSVLEEFVVACETGRQCVMRIKRAVERAHVL